MYNNILTLYATLFIVSYMDQSLQYAYSQSIPYVVEVPDIPMTNNNNNSSNDSKEMELPILFPNCTRALEVFTEKVSIFSRCTLLNARPIRVCTSCEKEINATEEAFNKLKAVQPSCHKFYFESDQVGIINLVYGQGQNLWSRNNCQNCYDHVNDTQEFFRTAEALDICIKRYNQTLGNGFNDTCDMCQELFVKMNNIYKDFVKRITIDESGGVCMDIVDQMNITRHLWSSQDCLRFDSNLGYPNIITAVLVGIIPVLFYLLSKNVSIIEDVKLVRPKRKSYASLQDSLPND